MQSVFASRFSPHLQKSCPVRKLRGALKLVQRARMSSIASHKLSCDAVKAAKGHEGRCLGALLGCFLGDALGAPVEGWSWEHIAREQKHFQRMESRRYTDDTQLTMALAKSLVSKGACDAVAATNAYVKAFDSSRGYGGSARKTFALLKEGKTDYKQSGRLGFPEGSFANGGAMRIAPVGLAYRHASPQVLHQAVEDALLCSHVHPEGIEGAYIQAAAIAALCKYSGSASQGVGSDMSPMQLLKILKGTASLQAMQSKLQVLLDSFPLAPEPQSKAGPCIDGSNWEGDAQSVAWQYDCKVLQQAGVEGFQIQAMDAVVCALWALCRHWQDPKAAIIAAVRGGGDSDTIAAMTGALSGALHGTSWIPEQWFDKLENGADGRDICVQLALQLSELQL